jgi:Flp pilus assembly protein TadG
LAAKRWKSVQTGQAAMANTAFIDRALKLVRELRTANGANVSVTFALAVIPVVGFVGAAVDYSQANSVKAAMQAAADSTALMLSKEAASLNQTQMQTKADSYFKALFNRPEAKNLNVAATYTTTDGSMVKVKATSDVNTNFMGVVGVSLMNVGVESQVKWGNARLRVALALDVTGSMSSDGKMTALKTATKKLLEQLQSAAAKPGDVYVSIIPFNKDVNVKEIANDHTAPWIRWDLWEEANSSCSKDTKNKEFTKDECLKKGGLWLPDNRNTWNFCITDRDQNYDTTNTAPATGLVGGVLKKETQFPAEQFTSCPAPLMGLSYNWTKLNQKVDELQPKGNTNQTIGVQWAFQSLTAYPFTIPDKDKNYKYSEIIILMSDGLNTENRFTKTRSAIDAREEIACTNAKNAGITIYAIQVNTGGDPTQQVMKNCASDPSKFYELKQANQLVATFQQIGVGLSNLRVSK